MNLNDIRENNKNNQKGAKEKHRKVMTPTGCWDGVSYMIEMPLDEARPQVDESIIIW